MLPEIGCTSPTMPEKLPKILQASRPHIARDLSQQAAEKSVMVLYVTNRVPFAFTHSITELIDGLADQSPTLAALRSAGATVTLYPVNTRSINLHTGINPLQGFRPEGAENALRLSSRVCHACPQVYRRLTQEPFDELAFG